MFSFRKVLGCILAPVGAFTIIGSGFSLWYFVDGDNPVATKPVDIGVNVINAVTQGKIEITQTPHLIVLSQGSNESENLYDGIMFYSTKTISVDGVEHDTTVMDDIFTFRYTNRTNLIPSDTNDLSDYGIKLNIAIYFELKSTSTSIDNSITKYLTIEDYFTDTNYCHPIDNFFSSDEENISSGSDYFFLTDNDVITEQVGFNMSYGNSTEDGTSYIEYTANLNRFFRYTSSDVKPDTVEKYKKLKEAITNGGWVINVYVAAFYSDLLIKEDNVNVL